MCPSTLRNTKAFDSVFETLLSKILVNSVCKAYVYGFHHIYFQSIKVFFSNPNILLVV